MSILVIHVENYKSLRDVTIRPGRISVIAGANAAGKSNLGDCFDFLREAYSNGLAVAIAGKGGYENIAHRKMRRTKRPIRFRVMATLSPRNVIRHEDFEVELPPASRREMYRISHDFAFVAKGVSIRAKYRIIEEKVVLERGHGDDWEFIYSAERQSGKIKLEYDKERRSEQVRRDRMSSAEDLEFFARRERDVSETELFINSFGRFVPALQRLISSFRGVKVFQLSPSVSREVGIPSPVPQLGRFGEDLPAVIDLLQRSRPRAWRSIINTMRVILPDLAKIEVDYTSNRRLGLFFYEKGVGKPWTTEDVSDGTIQMLALLTAIFDERASLLYIEEPENSIHPWAIRNFMKACRLASRERQIMITTHSPIVIDALSPADAMIAWRERGETRVLPLSELDADILQAWEKGRISTFKFLDSGVVPQSVPPASQLALELD